MKQFIWILFAATALVTACGGGGGGKDKSPIDEGNQQFSSGNFAAALATFEGAVASEGAPAAAGAGWCLLRLDNITRADSFFAVAAALDTVVNAYAGWSFTGWGLNSPQAAIDRADVVLGYDAAYIFDLDTRITFEDLVWIQASSYLQLGNYTSCYNKIHVLDGAYVMPTGTSEQIALALLNKLQTLGAATKVLASR